MRYRLNHAWPRGQVGNAAVSAVGEIPRWDVQRLFLHCASGSPYTLDYIERAMAFFDVAFGVPLIAQTHLPQEIRRARLLNPNAVILPYRLAEEQETNPAAMGLTNNSNVSLDYQFLQSVPPEWYLRDSKGNIVFEQGWPSLYLMNVSSYAPAVTVTAIRFSRKLAEHRDLPSGEWDGIFSITFLVRSIQHPQLHESSVDRR